MSNQSTDQPAGTNPPVISPQMDLPPLPADISTSGVSPQATQQPNPSGSAPPPESPPIISSAPKKKFGGGKIIATILGVLLLVGGVGAGIFLTQQQQDIREKAYTTQQTYTDSCNLIEITAADQTSCPKLSDNSGQNNISEYTTNFYLKNVTDGEHVVSIIKNSNFCTEGFGKNNNGRTICNSSTKQESLEITIAPGETQTVSISRTSDTGTVCGSFQTDLLITAVDQDTSCTGQGSLLYSTGQAGLASWGLCQTGIDCQSIPTPSPTPTASASCLNVKAYNSDWTEMATSELPNLKAGDSVNFCVTGSAVSGSFDKAQFWVTGVTMPETTAKRPNTTDYCQPVGITNQTTVVNVKARIHHAELNQWVGETF